MAEAINNGGPAFPVLEEDGRGNLTLTSTGMTKRDFFAAMAMQGDWADAPPLPSNFFESARSYYAMADAMLKARAE